MTIDEQPKSQQRKGPEAFEQRSGFFRTRRNRGRDARFEGWSVDPGPRWSTDEANRQIRAFLDRLTEDREVEDHDDPAEFARENGLLLLFGPEEQLRFQAVLNRLPEELENEWRELLSGGSASEAFGPLTLDEQLDEAQMATSLDRARKTRRLGVVLGAVAAVAVVVGVVALFTVLRDDPPKPGAIVFEEVAAGPLAQVDRAGPPPAANDRLTSALRFPLVVEPGDGEEIDRVVEDPGPGVLPAPTGSVWASIMQYGGRPQIVLVGEQSGWQEDLCILLTATTEDLRPIDVAFHEGAEGACGDQALGRPAQMWCEGETAVMFDLAVPAGEIDLIEGGTGTWSAVRIQLRKSVADYELSSLRGAIEVGEGQTLEVPVFGGDEGSEVTFELGEVSGSCTLL